MEGAASLYLDPISSSDMVVTVAEWNNLIEQSSVQLMYAQKVGRLFLQAAVHP